MTNSIKEARKEIGMTGAFLAKKAVISRSYLNTLEKCIGEPSAAVRERIAKVLQKKVSEIFFLD